MTITIANTDIPNRKYGIVREVFLRQDENGASIGDCWCRVERGDGVLIDLDENEFEPRQLKVFVQIHNGVPTSAQTSRDDIEVELIQTDDEDDDATRDATAKRFDALHLECPFDAMDRSPVSSDTLNQEFVIESYPVVDGISLRLSLTPTAIREHFDGSDRVQDMTDDDLYRVGLYILTDDGFYREFNYSICLAFENLFGFDPDEETDEEE